MKRHTALLTRFAVACAGLALVLLCTNYQDNNPASSTYHGDYKLKIAWISLPSPLYIDTEYSAACTTGVDTFQNYAVPDSLLSVIDTAILSHSPHDTLHLRFFKEFHGILIVRGIRPNHDEVRDSAIVSVINPQRPAVSIQPSISVGTGVNYLTLSLVTPSGFLARPYWTIKNSSRIDSQITAVPSCTLSVPVTVAGTFGPETLLVWARNSRGYVSDTQQATLFIHGVVPSIDSLLVKDSLRCGDTLRLLIGVGGLAPSKFSAIVRASPSGYLDTSALFGFPASVLVTMRKPLVDTVPQSLVITLRDSSGVLSQQTRKTVTLVHFPVSARFLKDTLLVSLGDTTLISVVDSVPGSVRYVWRFGANDSQITTTAAVSWVFSDTVPMRITVYGVDRFGYRGPADSALVLARPFDYKLSALPDSFPDTVVARHTATWAVTLDNPTKLLAHGGKYYWHVSLGGRLVDSSGPTLTSLSMTIPDSVPLTVSVQAKDTLQGSSAAIIRPVTVRLFRPYFSFAKHADTARINSPLVVRILKHDTNPTGWPPR